ncbi:MAG: ABC transporter permease [Prevotella sp.]|jgi:ABC-type antimicrobial peptide transport system permease subunit|nr:ABC transporter permease [Prevotella sp.]
MNLINIKIIFRSLLKNKFYSILSILGIALTFIFLTVVFIAIRQMTGNIPPDVNKDKTISFSAFRMENGDDKWVDSSLVKNYLNLKEPEYIAYLNSQAPAVFHNERIVQEAIGYVNADFFNIFKFEYIAGKAFDADSENTPVVVMTDGYAQQYFGKTDVVGSKYELQGYTFTVIAVVKKAYQFSAANYGLYIPYKFDRFIPQRDTGHTIFLKVKDQKSVKAASDELNRMNRQLFQQGILKSPPVIKEWDAMNVIDQTPVLASLGAVIILLLLIPAFNILSLNSGRITDQTEELSIKKAYGASRLKIFRELITENIVNTSIGSLLGLALTMPFIYAMISLVNNFSSQPLSMVFRIDIYVVAIVAVTTNL